MYSNYEISNCLTYTYLSNFMLEEFMVIFMISMKKREILKILKTWLNSQTLVKYAEGTFSLDMLNKHTIK